MESHEKSTKKEALLFKWFVFGIAVTFICHTSISQQLNVEGFATFTAEKNYSSAGVPLLQDFYFRFNSGDRNIQSIAVLPDTQAEKIQLEYFDDSRNDEFYYKITHRDFTRLTGVITDSKVFFLNGEESLPLNKPGENYEMVLTGFKIYYHGDSHNIKEFGVFQEERAGNQLLTVAFNDKNNDDLAVGIVHYAWLPGNYIGQSGVSSRTNVTNTSSLAIPNGIRVIKGFNFEFNGNDDSNLTEVGILTTTSLDGNLNVLFSDKNDDPSFDWSVNWAILSEPRDILVKDIPIIVSKFSQEVDSGGSDDNSSIEQILHEDFIFYSSKKEKLSKKSWIESLKAKNIKYSFSEEGTQIQRVSDNVAIVTTKSKEVSSDNLKTKQDTPSKNESYILKMVYENNQWRIARMNSVVHQ